MQPDNLNVFDFDGTLIKVNSFKEITKIFSLKLLRKFRIMSFWLLATWYIFRRLGIMSHFEFKRRVVDIFEKSLTEDEKQNISQKVFDENVNEVVFERMLKLDNCFVCTASPFSYVSRISFKKKDVVVIGSLCPGNFFPDPANFGMGKVENIKAHFKGSKIRIMNLYTDSEDDKPLLDIAVNAFLCKKGNIVKVK